MLKDISHLTEETREAIAYCLEHGLMKGVAADLFAPDLAAPRWQQAIMLARVHRATKEYPDHYAGKVRSAVAMIIDDLTGQLGSGGSLGGGYYWTNSHVVTRPDGSVPFMVSICWDAGPVSYAMGPVVYNNPAKDLSIIRADIGEGRLLLPRLQFETGPILYGEPLTAVGSPVGLIGTLSHGVISYENREMSYVVNGVRTKFRRVIQTDAPINPGNSGGVAFNRHGRVVGVPSAKLTALEGLGFCISTDDLLEALAEVEMARVPPISRPDYEGSPEGYEVSMRTHYMDTRNVTHIVAHHTGDLDTKGNPVHRDTSAADINRYHRKEKGWAGIGYHFVIRWDGRIEIGRSIYTQGAHAGASMNPRSWGVVFSGNFDVARPTAAQMHSWRWLRKYLGECAVVPSLTATDHRSHGATSCPGKNLTLAELTA